MAEMDIYHTQKVEDFATLAKEHLDGEIEFYEQVSHESHTHPRPATLLRALPIFRHSPAS